MLHGGGDILRIIPLISRKHPDPDTRTCGTTGQSSSRIIRHQMKTSATFAIGFYVRRFVRIAATNRTRQCSWRYIGNFVPVNFEYLLYRQRNFEPVPILFIVIVSDVVEFCISTISNQS